MQTAFVSISVIRVWSTAEYGYMNFISPNLNLRGSVLGPIRKLGIKLHILAP